MIVLFYDCAVMAIIIVSLVDVRIEFVHKSAENFSI